jgi:hypothetical protein
MSMSSYSRARCTECGREVDEFMTIAERWLYYSDGRDLNPYCPACAKREFAEDAPASERAAQSRVTRRS